MTQQPGKKSIRVDEEVFYRAQEYKQEHGLQWNGIVDPRVATNKEIQHACEKALEVKIPDKVLDA
jgi:hypothetical protein